MSKKAEPKVYTSVGWPCLKSNQPIVKYIHIGHERYPLTQIQWERRQARLQAKGVGG